MTYTFNYSKRDDAGNESETAVYECDDDFGRKVATLQRIAAKLAGSDATAKDLLNSALLNVVNADDGA